MKLDSSNRTLVYDIEANDLLEQVTKIWCVYAKDVETGEGFLFHDYPQFNGASGIDDLGEPYVLPKRAGNLKQGVIFLHRAKALWCHNQLGYDQFLMKKFYPNFKIRYNYPEIRDTLLESQVQFFNRPAVLGYKGIHGLAPWGARVGIRKPEIEDWSYIDADKLNRCIQDVDINHLVADKLTEEREQIAERCNGLNFEQALKVEHEYRYWCSMQEQWGAKVDVPHMERCIKELDQILEELKSHVEPHLPPVCKPKGIKLNYEDLCRSLEVGSLDVSYLSDEFLISKLAIPTNQKVLKHSQRAKALRLIQLDKKSKIVQFRRSASPWMNKPNITEEIPNKPFVKPVVNYTKTEKIKEYTAVNEGLGISQGGFSMLKLARAWVKETYPDSKGWKYPKEETEKEVLNHHTCKHFGYEPEDIDKFGGAFSKVEFVESDMNQGAVVKRYLLSLGWKPTEWTYKTDSKGNYIMDSDFNPIQNSPKLTEDSYESLPEGIGQSIAKYNTLKHRRTYIKNEGNATKGVLNNVREDGRVTCGIMTFGTVSGRASHYNIVNLPSVQAEYGENMRKIIIAEEGYVLCGADMPNCHPRVLSYLTQNQRFLDAVRSGKESELDGTFVGTDFHTVNAILFGLITEEDRDEAARTQDHDLIEKVLAARKKGKGLSFLCLYGGSAKKLAGLIDVSVKEAQKRIDSFFEGLGLDTMLDDLNDQWNNQGRLRGAYISVYGGYHIWCGSKHKLINTMAIGSEAALQKYSIIWIMNEVTKLGLDVKMIAGFHDEVLFEVNEKDREAFKPLAERFYEEGALLMGIDNDFITTSLWGDSYATCH